MTALMVRRRDAAQAVLARFDGKPFAWGKADCVRLAAAALRASGHRVSLAKAGSYGSLKGALAALKRAGFESLEAALDAQGLPRIAPAAALAADIVALPGDAGDWPALTVSLGNGRVLGFKDGVCGVLQPLETVAAWRVLPCRK